MRIVSGAGRLGVAVVPLAAGLVAVIVLLAVPRSSSHASCGPAPVPAAARQALAAYAGLIEYTSDRYSDGAAVRGWTDPLGHRSRYVAFDSRGRLSGEVVTYVRGGAAYTGRLFITGGSYTLTGGRIPRTAPLFVPRSHAVDLAHEYRDSVARGDATIVGRTSVGGHAALHLTSVLKPPRTKAFRGFPTIRVDSWVDPLTYLPLRDAQTSSDGRDVTVFSWLPRTPANVALTRLVIPAGLKRIQVRQGKLFGGKTVVFNGGPCRQS